MRMVLDANQFVSAVLVPYGRPAQILRAWREGAFELVLSLPILAEIRRVLLYPRSSKGRRFELGSISKVAPEGHPGL